MGENSEQTWNISTTNCNKAKVNTQNDGLQRARGCVEIGIGPEGLTRLYQSGSLRVLMPKSYTPAPQAVLINTSGGVAGGDRLETTVRVKADAALTVTTQAAERIYHTSGDAAEVANTLSLGANSVLEWLPQETILFDGCALRRRLSVTLATTARLLAVEMLVLGRKAMGETLIRAAVSDQWHIYQEGRLRHVEALRFAGDVANSLNHPDTLGGARALATLVYVAKDAQTRLDGARELLRFEGVENGVEAAASAWDGKLVVRFLASDAQPLRAALMVFLTRFRGCDLPRVWSM